MNDRLAVAQGGLRAESARTVLLLVLICLIALALRIAISYHAVFGKEFVAFIETDAWYHMRLVDAAVRDFPHRIWHDPYLVYPGGEAVNAGPFFDWMIAAAALILGLGSPDERLINVVGAYTPTVFGALTCIPVYFLGRELFSRRAGLWAALVVGVLPGQILTRSSLGFTDHHCAETLLSTCAFMFVVLALKAARTSKLALAVLAGISLGCYLLTWGGGSLVVAILVAWAAFLLISSRLGRNDAGSEPLEVLWPAFAVAALMVLPWVGTRPYFLYDEAALGGGLLFVCVLWMAAGKTRRYASGRALYLAFLGAGATATVLVAALAAGRIAGLELELTRLSPFRSAGFVTEATPLLRSNELWPFPLWHEFGPSLLLAGLAVCRLAVGAMTTGGTFGGSRAASRMGLLVVWSAAMLAATFGQVRFSYYLAVNIALLAGYGCDLALHWMDRLPRGAWPREDEPSTHEAGIIGRAAGARRHWRFGVAIALAAALAAPAGFRLVRNLDKTTELSDDWYDALQWLRSRTPEPFGTEDAYYRPPPAGPFADTTARNTYGVMAWWDYGYWITRIARRVPNTNPRQTQVGQASSFLLSEDPAAAGEMLKALGTRYVVVDARLQSVLPRRNGDEVPGFFLGIITAAGRTPTDYCGTFRLRDDDTKLKTYCYPKYYRSMAVRLFAFGGQAVAPRSVTVISVSAGDAERRQRVLDERRFPSYETADQFVKSRPKERWRIASGDPLESCVALEPVRGYHRVFESWGHQSTGAGRAGPSAVQIYEFSKDHTDAERRR